jgi:hypothetical protein
MEPDRLGGLAMGHRVDITVDEIVLNGLSVADPAGLADAVGARLAGIVTERGLPERRAPGPVTVHLAESLAPGRLAAALAEAIWSGMGEGR